MTRVKPILNVPVINSTEEADALLARIAGLKRQIDLVELSAAEEIDRVKLHAATETEPFRQEIAGMEQALIKYAEYHKPDLFAKKKSLELCFGVIGYRASTKLRTLTKWTWERVLGALREDERRDCIRVKEEVDKEALKTLAPDVLARYGVRAVPEDAFFYELKDDVNGETAA